MEKTKPKEQIIKLRDILKKELEGLPDKNFFGDSNEESKRESRKWIKQLDSALEGILIKDIDSEVYYWLIGKNASFGTDYGVD